MAGSLLSMPGYLSIKSDGPDLGFDVGLKGFVALFQRKFAPTVHGSSQMFEGWKRTSGHFRL